MAGEISSADIKIKFCAETTAGTIPVTGYAENVAASYLKIAEYVTGISGLGAEYDQYDVTPLAELSRHRFIKGLQNNDGNISFACNINPLSRSSWNAIVAEYAALTNGKGMWWEITLPGDDQSVFFRAEPCEMRFPDVESAQAVQGAVQLIENQYAGWAAKST